TSSHALAMSNTLVADNSNTGVIVNAFGSGLATKAVFNRVQVLNNGVAGINVGGIATTGRVDAIVQDSVVTNNLNAGLFANSSGATINVMAVRSVLARNSMGIRTSGNTATVRISASTLTANNTTWTNASGGSLASYGDNRIDGNRDGDPPLPTTIAAKQRTLS